MSTKDEMQRHVTLEERETQAKMFLEKSFPCPVCGRSLAFRIARTKKPYCHCDSCVIQIFFRGQAGIERLRKLLNSGVLGSSAGSHAVVLYNRLEQLKMDERDLKNKQGVIFKNADLDPTILTVQREIEKVRLELQKVAGSRRNK